MEEREQNTTILRSTFHHGQELHRQGQLADAERVFRGALGHQPAHFDALYLLGSIAFQTGRGGRVDRSGHRLALKQSPESGLTSGLRPGTPPS
jgi:hypothetical protein